MFKVTARDQGHYKGPSGAFVTYCNISCLNYFLPGKFTVGGLGTGCLGQIGNIIRLLFCYYLLVLKRTVFE